MNQIATNLEKGITTVPVARVGTYEDLLDWYKSGPNEYDLLLNKNGGSLFRGFHISDVTAFDSLLQQLPECRLAYIDGNSPRDKVFQILTRQQIFHPNILFQCITSYRAFITGLRSSIFVVLSPECNGYTLIADCRKLLNDLDSTTVEEFSKRKVMYTILLHGGWRVALSWQETFEVQAKFDLESYGDNNQIEYIWRKDNAIHLSQIGPGIIRHPVTNDEVWFNQTDQFHLSNLLSQVANELEALTKGERTKLPTYAFWGDGREIPPDRSL